MRALMLIALVACGDDGEDCPIDVSTGLNCHGLMPDGRYNHERCAPAIANTLAACPIYINGMAATSVEANERCQLWHNDSRCNAALTAVLECWEQDPPTCDCTTKVALAQECYFGR
jgi:hypothetical protein